MKLKTFVHNNDTYVLQSYKKGERAHIVCQTTKMGFILNLEKNKINGTYSKQDAKWDDRCSQIEVKEVNRILTETFL